MTGVGWKISLEEGERHLAVRERKNQRSYSPSWFSFGLAEARSGFGWRRLRLLSRMWDHHGMQPVLARDARRWDAVIPRDGWCSAEGGLLTPRHKLDPQIHGEISAPFLEFWFLFITSQNDPKSPNHVRIGPSRKLAPFPLCFAGLKTQICAEVWFFSLIPGL